MHQIFSNPLHLIIKSIQKVTYFGMTRPRLCKKLDSEGFSFLPLWANKLNKKSVNPHWMTIEDLYPGYAILSPVDFPSYQVFNFVKWVLVYVGCNI